MPYFFMSELDETARDLDYDARATLTIAESALWPAACKGVDAEDATCAKLSLHGLVVRATDQRAGLAVLVDKQPSVQHWPASHGFHVYEMRAIEDVFVLCAYGGARVVSPADYMRARAAIPRAM
jgi:hypothetical protein